MDDHTVKRRIEQKWGFGMAPFKPATERRYVAVAKSLQRFLGSDFEYNRSVAPTLDEISATKGLFFLLQQNNLID